MPAAATACCPHPPADEEADPAASAFAQFIEQVYAAGTLDAKTTELLAVALSLQAKCDPCLRLHLGKARAAGCSETEIEAAAWLAISFGGAPLLMHWKALQR